MVSTSFGKPSVSIEIRSAKRQLLIDGRAAKLGARAFDVLQALYERRDRLVTKHELLDVVWPGVVVEENNLQVQISTLRRLLGPQAIATIPGRGYRFTAGSPSTQTPARVEPACAMGRHAAAARRPYRGNLPDVCTRAVRPRRRIRGVAFAGRAASARIDRRCRRHRQDAAGAGGRAASSRVRRRRVAGRAGAAQRSGAGRADHRRARSRCPAAMRTRSDLAARRCATRRPARARQLRAPAAGGARAGAGAAADATACAYGHQRRSR